MLPTNAWRWQQAIWQFPTVTKVLWHHMAPCDTLQSLHVESLTLLQISQNAHHHRTAFSCQNTGIFQREEGLRAEFLLFKIPNPTLATCYSEIRPGDPLHSSFFASFQGVTPFGRTFCTFFSRLRAKHLLGWQSDVVYVIIFFCLTFR